MGSPFHCLKGLLYDVLPGLGKNLDRNVPRDHVTFYKGSEEVVFSLGSSGKAYFDLLKSDIGQELEELDLLLKAHGLDKGLIAIPEVNGTPDGGLVNVVLLNPVICAYRRHEIRSLVLLVILHIINLLIDNH